LNACPNCSFASLESFAFCPQCGTKLPPGAAGPAVLIGRTLNSKYRLLREIGQGSMGTVYEGEHISLKKRVAIKVLHADMRLGEESIQRFQREGIAAAARA
jgi:serine/threonine-protein kinase